jgi:hypothetical protein
MIRNCVLPALAANQSTGALGFFMREAMLHVGLWTENANDADSAWSSASNHVFTDDTGTPGFAVLAANSLQVTHSGAPFTQAMVDDGMVLALKAANDQNAVMLRITEFVDASTVKLDPKGFPSSGWTDETGIPGRVLDYGSALHTTGAWVEMDPPGGNNRARLELNMTNYVECYAQPKAGLADYTETPGSALTKFYDDDDVRPILNGWFDGNNALFYKWDNGDNFLNVVLWGELELPAGVNDTHPGFVMAHTNGFTTLRYQLYEWPIYMLGAASSTPIKAFSTNIGLDWSDAHTVNPQEDILGRRLINGNPGFARLRKPEVVLDDVLNEGGFIRGKLPLLRQGPGQGLADLSPVDAGGDWLHLYKGVMFPRNGAYDQLPLITA